MEQRALEHKPKLIIAGGSAYSREWDYARIRAIADKIGAIFLVEYGSTPLASSPLVCWRTP